VTTKTAPTSDRSAGVPPAVAGASRHASATSTSETAAVCRTGKLPQQLTSSRSVSKTLSPAPSSTESNRRKRTSSAQRRS